MNRGDIWLAQVGSKRRPVLVLTRDAVIDRRTFVTVAEVTTSIRGLSVEVAIDHEVVGLDQPSVVNCDGIHTMSRSSLTSRVGEVDAGVLDDVCAALTVALGC